VFNHECVKDAVITASCLCNIAWSSWSDCDCKTGTQSRSRCDNFGSMAAISTPTPFSSTVVLSNYSEAMEPSVLPGNTLITFDNFSLLRDTYSAKLVFDG